VSNYKLVMFDFDGTLADSYPLFIKILNRAAIKYKFKQVEKHEENDLKHCSAREIIKILEIPKWKMPFFVKYIRHNMTEKFDQVTLFEGVGNLLQDLKKQDVKLAIISTSSYQYVTNILGDENTALIDHFQCSASPFGKSKKLKKTMKKFALKNQECLLIGDEIRDIDAARKASIPIGVVSWGYTHIDALNNQNPDEHFLQLEHIKSVFRSSSRI